MARKFTDIVLALIILAFPMLGLLQACGGGGNPATPPDQVTPPDDNHTPVASVAFNGAREGPTPFMVSIDASNSFDPDGDELSYTWIFSDGATYEGPEVHHELIVSGHHDVRLLVSDEWGEVVNEGPFDIYAYGLANSPWPSFGGDARNSGTTLNVGPQMDLENADSGGAFPRYWRSGIESAPVRSICISYDNVLIYTQGDWIRARTAWGDRIWDYHVEAPIMVHPAVRHDGAIVFCTVNGLVYCIDANGTLIWSTQLIANDDPEIRFEGAVNIDGLGQIYLSSGPWEQDWDVYVVTIYALSSIGNILWTEDIEAAGQPFSPHYPSVAAITPDGNIVVNGDQGVIFNPDGEIVKDISYPSLVTTGTSEKTSYPITGPPSIGPDGEIAFSTVRCPLLTQSGDYVTELLGPDVYLFGSNNLGTGYMTAPVWGVGGISLLNWTGDNEYNESFEFYANTRTEYGGIARTWVSRYDALFPYVGGSTYIQGVAEDGDGNLYVSSLKLHAYSPITSGSLYPYVTHRHSMWTYARPSSHLTTPVIGEDGWLYMGYGNDILAIGD